MNCTNNIPFWSYEYSLANGQLFNDFNQAFWKLGLTLKDVMMSPISIKSLGSWVFFKYNNVFILKKSMVTYVFCHYFLKPTSWGKFWCRLVLWTHCISVEKQYCIWMVISNRDKKSVNIFRINMYINAIHVFYFP